MSTQRRENRWLGCTERTGASGMTISASVVRRYDSFATGGTAPTYISSWLATNSLFSDHRIVQLAQFLWLIFSVQSLGLVQFVQFVQFVCPVLRDKRRGSQPFGAGGRTAFCTPAILGSSYPHIPLPSGVLCFHPSLPQAPAGRRRWAERYDGKRDLYLQHAA